MSGTIFFICLTSAISALSAAENFSLISCTKTMAKRMREQKENNRIVAKSKPTAVNLAVTVSTSSSPVNRPIVSKNPRILKASSRQIGCSGKLDVRSNRNSNPDAASSSQGWQKDALLDVCTGKLAAPENSEDSETEGRVWPHHFHVSRDCVPHMEKVFSFGNKLMVEVRRMI